MKNLKLISKVAILFGVVAIVFTVLGAIATYEQFQISISASGQTVPADYLIVTILLAILPYLFVAVLSLVVAFILRGQGKETVAQTQPTA